jgi:ribosome-binding protein aMBF1 (putative translation factor)
MRHETRKIERTAEEKARLKAIRERFQREKPSVADLVKSGEYGPPIPTVAYFGVAALVKRLRAEREAIGLSLADLADRTGMDKAALCRLETGRHGNPTVDTLARYAAALGKTVTFGVADLPGRVRARPGTDAGTVTKSTAQEGTKPAGARSRAS